MIYFLGVFLLSFFLNDARILNNILGGYLNHVKYKAVLLELGMFFLVSCIILNFFKGFFLIYTAPDSLKIIIAVLLLIGNFLGSRPGITGGSEIILLWGICLGYDLSLVKIPLAIFLGSFIIFRKFRLALILSSVTICILLLVTSSFAMFLLTTATLLIKKLGNGEPFASIVNKLKEERFLIRPSEVNDL